MKYYSDPIPCKLYVKRFIEEGNVIKPYILKALYPLFHKAGGLDKDVQLSEYQHSTKIELPEYIFENNGWMLNRQNVVVFNTILEGYIKDRFECEFESNIRRSLREEKKFMMKDMINDLCADFGFSEHDLPYETIKKSLQRFSSSHNIDFQEIKIFKKCVPKKHSIIQDTSTLIPRATIMRECNISHTTFCNKKNRGEFVVVKQGRNVFVDIVNSTLPITYNVVKP